MWEALVDADGRVAWGRRIALAPRPDKSYLGPGGLALDEQHQRAYVCVSRANRLAIVDLAQGREVGSIGVGVAPYAVVLDAGAVAGLRIELGRTSASTGRAQGGYAGT